MHLPLFLLQLPEVFYIRASDTLCLLNLTFVTQSWCVLLNSIIKGSCPWTWLKMLFLSQLTARRIQSMHHLLVVSSLGSRKSIQGVLFSFLLCLYVVTLPDMFLLLFLWISQLRQTLRNLPQNHTCCLNEWEASNSNALSPGTSCIAAWVQQECWYRLGADGEGKNQNLINIWQEASRLVHSWVKMTFLLCYCFSDWLVLWILSQRLRGVKEPTLFQVGVGDNGI